MKIHQETKTRTLIPYLSLNINVDFEGTMDEWEKVKGDLLQKIDVNY